MKRILLSSFFTLSLLGPVALSAAETIQEESTTTFREEIAAATDSAKDQGFDSFTGVKYKLKEFGKNTLSATLGLSIFKILQGKWAVKDIFMPNLDFTVPLAGTSLAWSLRFKPLTLLTDGGWSASIKRFLEKNDKGVLAAFLAFYWYQFCGGTQRLIKDDATLSKEQNEHRRTFIALTLALASSYAVKNLEKLGGKGAAILAAAALMGSLPRPASV